MGITGGGGTTIVIYDDADSASGVGYTFAEISAALPTDLVDLSTSKPSYRGVQTIQIGSSAGSATTTLVDTVGSTVIFNSGKSISFFSVSASWNLKLGTQVGSGNKSSGKAGSQITFGTTALLRGNCYLYQTSIKGTVIAMSPTGSIECDLANCIIDASSFSTITGSLATLYNVDFSASGSSHALATTDFGYAERLTAAATSAAQILSPGSGLSVKDLIMFGSPTGGDIRLNPGSDGGSAWQLIRPTWSGNAGKFTNIASLSSDPDSCPGEYWLYDTKVVDKDGVGILGIPVRLTDNIGSVQVDTTTDSTGQISFGTGLLDSAVRVADYYNDGSNNLAIRHRSPFYTEINLPSMAGYNANYKSLRYYWRWPGYATITTSTGTFEDVNDTISLQDPSGQPTSWTECSL